MTVAPSRDAVAQAAAAKLRVTASTAAAGLSLVAVKLVLGWGITCPFRALTGWRCPLCGATTMGVDLVRGRLADAWRQNQVCFVGLLGLMACCVWWLCQAGGIDLRRARPMSNRHASGAASTGQGSRCSRPSRNLWTQNHLYAAATVVAVGWVLVRNLVPSLRMA